MSSGAALYNQPLPDISVRRSAGLDVITGRPRVENTQYTSLTKQQLANIQKVDTKLCKLSFLKAMLGVGCGFISLRDAMLIMY